MSGTKVYCPNCEEFKICESLPFNESPAYRSRPPKKYFGESQVFLRYRQCNSCGSCFMSAELPFKSIEKAEAYISEIYKLSNKYHEK